MSYSSAPQWQGASQSYGPPPTGPSNARPYPQTYQPDPLSNAMSSMSLSSSSSAEPSATVTSLPTMPYYYEPSSQNMNHPAPNQQQPTTTPTPPASYGTQPPQVSPATYPQAQAQLAAYAAPQPRNAAANSQTLHNPQPGPISPPPPGYPGSPYTMISTPQAGQIPPQASPAPSSMSIPGGSAQASAGPQSTYSQTVQSPNGQYQQSPPGYSMANPPTVPAYARTNRTYPSQQTQSAPATKSYSAYQNSPVPVSAASPASASYAPSPAPTVQQPYQTPQPQASQISYHNPQAPPSNPTYAPGPVQIQQTNTHPPTTQYDPSQGPVQAQATRGTASSYYGNSRDRLARLIYQISNPRNAST